MADEQLRPFHLRRSSALYMGLFDEPAFAMLGNPAELFANLLRHLRPFGATVESLSVDTSTLAGAYVSCVINPDTVVRARVLGLEVFAKPSTLGTNASIALAEAAGAAISATALAKPVVRQELTLNVWGSIEGQTYQELAATHCPALTGQFAGLVPRIDWRGTDFVFGIEEAEDMQGGLFVRAVAIEPNADPIRSIAMRLKDRAKEAIATLGVDAGEYFQ